MEITTERKRINVLKKSANSIRNSFVSMFNSDIEELSAEEQRMLELCEKTEIELHEKYENKRNKIKKIDNFKQNCDAQNEKQAIQKRKSIKQTQNTLEEVLEKDIG